MSELDLALVVGQTIEFVTSNPELSVGIFAAGVLGMAFTKIQRNWIKERDGYKCQHPDETIRHGGQLEVDHIIPQRIGYGLLGLTEEQVDSPQNGITECTNHHRGHPKSRHPDAHQALYAYHEDTTSFDKLQQERDEKLAKGEKYWNDQYDNELVKRARENTINFVLRTKKPFPKHRHNGKNGKDDTS